MNRRSETATMAKPLLIALALGLALAGCVPAVETTTGPASGSGAAGSGWREDFTVDRNMLRNTGHNTYFCLDPGHRVTLEGREGSHPVQVIITVLNETEVVDGVTCRVIEERESKHGKLVEVSRNFYAIDPATRNVYYFGEDVDNYGPDGRIRDHESAWRSGVNGARFGMMMPGEAAVGQKYYQEQAEADEAMDRAEHVSVTETLATPAGRFTNCLKIEETSPLEPGHVSSKLYAPEVGMVRDGALQLVSFQSAPHTAR